MNIKIKILVLISFILFVSSCKKVSELILFDNAVVNISDKTINEYGIYQLNGKWEFYPNQLISPIKFNSNKKQKTEYVYVPSFWQNYSKFENININYATYRLQIVKNKNDKKFGLRINNVNSAYKIWVNGNFLCEVGKVSDEVQKIKPKRNTTVNYFSTHKDSIDLVIQVSNFKHSKGGIIQSVELASEKAIVKSENKRLALDFFLFGLMLIVGIYHLIFYVLRRDVLSTLFFALLTLSTAIHLSVSGDFKIINLLYSDISWNLQLKIDYLFYYFIFLFFSLFIVSMFKKEVKKLFLWIMYGFTSIMSLIVLFSKPILFTKTLFIFDLFIVFAIVYLIYVIVKALVHQIEGAKLTLLGSFILVIAIVNDILNEQMLISSIELVPYALVIFIFIESYIISAGFSKAYIYSDELTQELDYVNNNLEKLVKERTLEVENQKEELAVKTNRLLVANDDVKKVNDILEAQTNILNKKNKSLTDSLNYAKRLQSAVLPDASYLHKRLPEHFIYFNPKDIVSGDFYWYGEVDSSWDFDDASTIKILIASDCTGHGVPGAFMTLLGHNFLHLIVNIQEVIDPEQILYKLDQLVVETLRQRESGTMKDGMDIAIIALDEQKQQITFAGAGNPLFYVRNNELFEIKGSSFGIGGVLRNREKVFEPHKITYQKGDVFYIFSDGFYDQIGGGEGRKFYKKRFKELLIGLHKFPLDEQKSRLHNVFERWKSDKKQIDDVLIVGLKT